MRPMTRSERSEGRRAPPEHRESLWLLTAAPAIWLLHFLLSYLTAAIWCAKAADRAAPLAGVRVAIGLYTLAAVLGIGLTAWRGYRQHRLGKARRPHDADTAADRHRFLGFATLLLSALSLVATLYVALVVVFIGSCV